MSLFGAIQQSANSLQVSQLGLQVTGNNVSNANTPGYIRQELVQATAIGYRQGSLVLGYGVRATAVIQKQDQFLAARMRETSSDLSKSDVLKNAYATLENVFSELSSNDISTAMSQLSNAFQDLANQPHNDSLRALLLERTRTLVGQVHAIDQKVTETAVGYDKQISNMASEINRLTEQIATLNNRIVEIEGGDAINSDAVGLRDERVKVLDDLAQLVDIRVSEQSSGAVSVFVGGDYLVTDGISRKLVAVPGGVNPDDRMEIRIADTDIKLQVRSGALAGIYEAQKSVLGGITNQLNSFAKTFIDQFNMVHSQGQGTRGFSNLTGATAVGDVGAPLENAGLGMAVENGRFQIQTIDGVTGLNKTTDIFVNLDGLGTDTTLTSLAQSIDAIPGLSATVNADRKLSIKSDSPNITFSFQNDTSGVLAALGLNTYFVGDSASTMAINPIVENDTGMIATSLEGVGRGTDNAIKLAQLVDQPRTQLGGVSIREIYEKMAVGATQASSTEKSRNDGLRNFYNQLESENLGITGVNLDEEAVKMMLYQRAFQASSKVITTANEMLDTLMKM